MLNKRWITLPPICCRPLPKNGFFERFWRMLSSAFTVPVVPYGACPGWNVIKQICFNSFLLFVIGATNAYLFTRSTKYVIRRIKINRLSWWKAKFLRLNFTEMSETFTFIIKVLRKYQCQTELVTSNLLICKL